MNKTWIASVQALDHNNCGVLGSSKLSTHSPPCGDGPAGPHTTCPSTLHPDLRGPTVPPGHPINLLGGWPAIERRQHTRPLCFAFSASLWVSSITSVVQPKAMCGIFPPKNSSCAASSSSSSHLVTRWRSLVCCHNPCSWCFCCCTFERPELSIQYLLCC